MKRIRFVEQNNNEVPKFYGIYRIHSFRNQAYIMIMPFNVIARIIKKIYIWIKFDRWDCR